MSEYICVFEYQRESFVFEADWLPGDDPEVLACIAAEYYREELYGHEDSWPIRIEVFTTSETSLGKYQVDYECENARPLNRKGKGGVE